MIKSDQPTIFPDEMLAGVSSVGDGTMLDRSLPDRHDVSIVHNREEFCRSIGIDYASCVYQIISYDPGVTFDSILTVTAPNQEGVYADVLYTERTDIGLFLPIADCVGTILYDPVRKALALAHLGRHASLAKTMVKTVKHFVDNGTNPNNLLIWMAPSVRQASYRMEFFDAADSPEWRKFCLQQNGGFYLDLQGYNSALAVQSGVLQGNITVSPIDTAVSNNYFSHSHGDAKGRFAVVAMIRS